MKQDIIIHNLDEGVFYLFLAFSLYMIRTAIVDLESQVNQAVKVNNMVDASTQTDELTHGEAVEEEIHYDEHLFDEIVPIQVKKKLFGLW